jgi:hypothetical protein
MSQRVRLTTYVDPEIDAKIAQLAGRLSPSRMAEILLIEALAARSQAPSSPVPESGRLPTVSKSSVRRPSVRARQRTTEAR